MNYYLYWLMVVGGLFSVVATGVVLAVVVDRGVMYFVRVMGASKDVIVYFTRRNRLAEGSRAERSEAWRQGWYAGSGGEALNENPFKKADCVGVARIGTCDACGHCGCKLENKHGFMVCVGGCDHKEPHGTDG